MIKIFNRLGTVATILVTLLFFGTVVGAVGSLYVVLHYSRGLPEYGQLEDYSPPTTTRLYASDGKLIEEYAKEKRLFVPFHAIPKRVVNAFIAAEDQNFYNHPGVDFASVFRAAVQNLMHMGQNKGLVGGSTITQQVVKNFLLTNEKSIDRKIKEAILAFRITKAFSKDKILELYLNQIYLGNRSYGVAAAALNYFNKSLSELSVEEAAMLAALPKAPSSIDPHRFPERAKERRDWVINRMVDEGFVDEVEGLLAIAKPITLIDRDETEIVSNADYFAESVRQQLIALYGEDAVYEKGLAVRTTLDPVLQNYAVEAFRKGLIEYDHRHGWRGPLTKLESVDHWQEELKKIPENPDLHDWKMAAVIGLTDKEASLGFADGKKGVLPVANMKWARKYLNENAMGPAIASPKAVLKLGDVVAVSPVAEKDNEYALQQIPAANGGLIAIDPHTGKVLAMVGGFGSSKFNRTMQAKRQPGSSFKPFVYLAALENGFSPNSIIVDEPVEFDAGPGQETWTPQNYSGEFYGPTTLRVGVEKSRNAMTVRLAQMIGIDKVVEIANRFGINNETDRNLSASLGSEETTLINLTNAYAMLVNGGKRTQPFLVERVQDKDGKTLYRRDTRECPKCSVEEVVALSSGESISEDTSVSMTPPTLSDTRETISDPIATYQIVSVLEGVIQRGTGQKATALGKILAGKTGTTNNSVDAWFVGFSADLAVGTYIGFDNPKSLGKKETGASAALPIWQDFMAEALTQYADVPFRRPDGIKLVKIDMDSGLLPTPETEKNRIIFEAFRAGSEPTTSYLDAAPDNGDVPTHEMNDFGTGGVY